MNPINDKGLTVIILSATLIGAYAIYKIFGGVTAVAAAAGDALADFNGSGAKADKAQALKEKITAVPQNDPFSPLYLSSRTAITGKKIVFLTAAVKVELCETIYKATGFWHLTDQSAVVLGAFKRCSHKTQVSDLSTHFLVNYKQNVLDYVDSQFKKWGFTTQGDHSDVFFQILEYVNKLPE